MALTVYAHISGLWYVAAVPVFWSFLCSFISSLELHLLGFKCIVEHALDSEVLVSSCVNSQRETVYLQHKMAKMNAKLHYEMVFVHCFYFACVF